jgi:hypothetical protein
MPFIARIAALTFVAAAAAGPLPAQNSAAEGSERPAASDGATATQDSARLLRSARREQAGFERYRANRLPRTFRGGGGGGSCDERIGRFCLWYSRDTTYQPREEPAAIDVRRARLLADLDSAAAALPGDSWIASQRVRYAVEAGENARALAAARECRADAWWCGALEGYALHSSGAHAEAEATFDAVLAAMDDDTRRRWTDLTIILPPAEQRDYRRMGGAEQEEYERRFWWLADPLWSEPGNDRRTEHFARWVLDGMQERARNTEGERWGPDLREILLRFGSPTARERYDQGGLGRTGMITHYPDWSWDFLPAAELVSAPHAIAADDWRLDDERARTSYAPAYAERFVNLPHQVARFRRGGRMSLIASYDTPEAFAARGGGPVRDGAVWYDADGGERIEAEARAGRGGRVIRLDVPRVPGVLSVEALATDATTAARARVGVAPADAAGVTLSDVLLLSDAGARPISLEAAVAVARGSAGAAAGEGVALYWEIYGLPTDVEEVTVAVSLAGGAPGWARRRLESLRVVSAAAPARIRWTEALEGEDVVPRSMAIGIPADARPGTYTLEISVDVPGQGTAVAERQITVVR